MKLNELTLINFRRFKSLNINFHPELTVIVAKNGQGKTSVLDAATIALSTFIGAFDLGKAKGMNRNDVRYHRREGFSENEQYFPVRLEARVDHFADPVIRELTGENNKTTIKGATALTNYGKSLMAKIRDLETITLPVMAYYGSGRLWNTHNNTTRKSVLSESRTMGYEDCFSSSSSFKQIQQWMDKATVAALQQKDMSAYRNYNLGDQIKGIQETVNRVLLNEGWAEFHYSLQHEELAMTHDELGVLPVSMLSDGMRAMVSMVADLSWRCTKLNPHMGEEAQQQTHGIVFIDEVDMHLHPAWQQLVIKALRDAFPKIQLIVTTHSPQVISTVQSESIRIIENGEMYNAPAGSKGAESSRMLKRIFDVDTRPQQDENTQLLQAYEKLVYGDQWNSDEARGMRIKLDEIFAGEEPKLTELDLYIENRMWELELEENQ